MKGILGILFAYLRYISAIKRKVGEKIKKML